MLLSSHATASAWAVSLTATDVIGTPRYRPPTCSAWSASCQTVSYDHRRRQGDHRVGTVEGPAALIDGKLDFGIAEEPPSSCTRPTRPVGQGQALPGPSELRSVGFRGDRGDI